MVLVEEVLEEVPEELLLPGLKSCGASAWRLPGRDSYRRPSSLGGGLFADHCGIRFQEGRGGLTRFWRRLGRSRRDGDAAEGRRRVPTGAETPQLRDPPAGAAR